MTLRERENQNLFAGSTAADVAEYQESQRIVREMRRGLPPSADIGRPLPNAPNGTRWTQEALNAQARWFEGTPIKDGSYTTRMGRHIFDSDGNWLEFQPRSFYTTEDTVAADGTVTKGRWESQYHGDTVLRDTDTVVYSATYKEGMSESDVPRNGAAENLHYELGTGKVVQWRRDKGGIIPYEGAGIQNTYSPVWQYSDQRSQTMWRAGWQGGGGPIIDADVPAPRANGGSLDLSGMPLPDPTQTPDPPETGNSRQIGRTTQENIRQWREGLSDLNNSGAVGLDDVAFESGGKRWTNRALEHQRRWFESADAARDNPNEKIERTGVHVFDKEGNWKEFRPTTSWVYRDANGVWQRSVQHGVQIPGYSQDEQYVTMHSHPQGAPLPTPNADIPAQEGGIYELGTGRTTHYSTTIGDSYDATTGAVEATHTVLGTYRPGEPPPTPRTSTSTNKPSATQQPYAEPVDNVPPSQTTPSDPVEIIANEDGSFSVHTPGTPQATSETSGRRQSNATRASVGKQAKIAGAAGIIGAIFTAGLMVHGILSAAGGEREDDAPEFGSEDEPGTLGKGSRANVESVQSAASVTGMSRHSVREGEVVASKTNPNQVRRIDIRDRDIRITAREYEESRDRQVRFGRSW